MPPRSGAGGGVPAEPPLGPLPPLPPPRREPAGRPDRALPPELLPRRLPDSSRDPYARSGQPAEPGALFRRADPDGARGRDDAPEPDGRPFRPAAEPNGTRGRYAEHRAEARSFRAAAGPVAEPDSDGDRYRPAEPDSSLEPATALIRPAAESGGGAPGPASTDATGPAESGPGPALATSVISPPAATTEQPPAGPAAAAPSSAQRITAPPSAPETPVPEGGLGADPRDTSPAPAAAVRRRTAPGRAAGRPAPGSIGDLLVRLDRLPDGHPSSPYEDGGLARPLPHRLRQLELGLPAPEREPADLTSLTDFGAAPARGSDGPAPEPRPADPGQDPYAVPAANGHGDSGHRTQTDSELALGPWETARADPGGSNGQGQDHAPGPPADLQEHLVAGLLAACRTAEGRNMFGEYGASGLTPAMRRIAHQLPRGGLAPDSEADTLKPPERLAAKLARLIARHPGRSPAELAAGIGDGVRYAFSFHPDYYTEGTWLVHRKLKAHGFELEARRNRWDSPEYKGVWTRWRDPAHDLIFEVQFHTGQSWDVLQRTHGAYVQITDPATPAAERARLRARQVAAAASAKAPPNCTEIADFGREAR